MLDDGRHEQRVRLVAHLQILLSCFIHPFPLQSHQVSHLSRILSVLAMDSRLSSTCHSQMRTVCTDTDKYLLDASSCCSCVLVWPGIALIF